MGLLKLVSFSNLITSEKLEETKKYQDKAIMILAIEWDEAALIMFAGLGKSIVLAEIETLPKHGGRCSFLNKVTLIEQLEVDMWPNFLWYQPDFGTVIGSPIPLRSRSGYPTMSWIRKGRFAAI